MDEPAQAVLRLGARIAAHDRPEACQRDEHAGIRSNPRGARVEGTAPPSWVLANIAAALCRRAAAHVTRTVTSIDDTGLALLRSEKSAASTASSQSAPAGGPATGAWAEASCWLSAAGSPVDTAGPSPSGKPSRDSGSDGLTRCRRA